MASVFVKPIRDLDDNGKRSRCTGLSIASFYKKNKPSKKTRDEIPAGFAFIPMHQCVLGFVIHGGDALTKVVPSISNDQAQVSHKTREIEDPNFLSG